MVTIVSGATVIEARYEVPAAPPNSKRMRKVRVPFSPALLTPGTVCEIDVGFGEEEPMHTERFTVEKLVKAGPLDYVVHFTTHKQPLALRLHDISRVVKHKTGSFKIDRSSELDRAKTFFTKQNMEEDFGEAKKHPSQYRTVFMEDLIETLVVRYKRDDQMVDLGKMNQMIADMNVFKVTSTGGFWGYPVYIVNKKKLQAAIRRALNKCLVNHTRAQKARDQVFGDNWTWDINLEDFTRENPHVIETGDNEIQLKTPQS
jgi:hypothetical protein